MASRFSQQKPNPAIKKNVIRARRAVKTAKRAQSFMVTISMAATLFGWAFFTHEDIQATATAQLANSTVVAASVQQSADTTATPLVTTIEVSNVSQIRSQVTATPGAITTVQ